MTCNLWYSSLAFILAQDFRRAEYHKLPTARAQFIKICLNLKKDLCLNT